MQKSKTNKNVTFESSEKLNNLKEKDSAKVKARNILTNLSYKRVKKR